MDFRRYSLSSGWVYRLNAYLSKQVDRIIANSWAGSEYHACQGYARDRIVVIPNGIDTGYFRPQPEEGAVLRRDWGFGMETPVIGRIGRLDPMKDYPTFLKAAAKLIHKRPEVRFAIVGGGSDQMRHDLQTMAPERIFLPFTVRALLPPPPPPLARDFPMWLLNPWPAKSRALLQMSVILPELLVRAA